MNPRLRQGVAGGHAVQRHCTVLHTFSAILAKRSDDGRARLQLTKRDLEAFEPAVGDRIAVELECESFAVDVYAVHTVNAGGLIDVRNFTPLTEAQPQTVRVRRFQR